MTIKTSKNLTSSLRGSAFRRAIWDGRSWLLRSIKTNRTLHHLEGARQTVTGRSSWGGPDLRAAPPIQSEPLEVRIRRFP